MGYGPLTVKAMPQAGMDSLGAMELRNAIANAFGVSLPATATFDYPTLGHLSAMIAAQQAPVPQPAVQSLALPAEDLSSMVLNITVQLRTLVGTILGAPVADDQPLMEVCPLLGPMVAGLILGFLVDRLLQPMYSGGMQCVIKHFLAGWPGLTWCSRAAECSGRRLFSAAARNCRV